MELKQRRFFSDKLQQKVRPFASHYALTLPKLIVLLGVLIPIERIRSKNKQNYVSRMQQVHIRFSYVFQYVFAKAP